MPDSTKNSDAKIAQQILELVGIMRRLRDPETGCAWDVAQTHASIAPYTIEEAYEVAEAVQLGDMDAFCDELGDLLLQIVFQAQIASEAGDFDLGAVAAAISQKMLNRHPHIFGDSTSNTAAPSDSKDVHEQWEELKANERQAKGHTRTLDGIASTLPPMMRARKLQKRAARVGFDWDEPRAVLAKLREEIDEVEAELNAQNADALAGEVGDMLFAVVNLARKLNINPETALAATNAKFTARFAHIEDQAKAHNTRLQDCSLEQLEAWWNEAKTL